MLDAAENSLECSLEGRSPVLREHLLKSQHEYIKIGPSVLRVGDGGCLLHAAAKVRPEIKFARAGMNRQRRLILFTLGPLMNALDLYEFKENSFEEVVGELMRSRGAFGRGNQSAHNGLIAWTAEAFQNYVTARERHLASVPDPCEQPVGCTWIVRDELARPDRRGAVRYERTAWGRRYRTADGGVREHWLLSFGEPRTSTPAEVGAVAFVTAFGRARTEKGRKPVGSDVVRPESVRVMGFGGASTNAVLLGEHTPDSARVLFTNETAPRYNELIDGRQRKPGGGCADCKELTRCGAPVEADVLPSLAASPHGTTTISASDLRAYAACPAKYHLLRELNLKDPSVIESPEIRRGRAVDDWLNRRHKEPGWARCSPEDLDGRVEAPLGADADEMTQFLKQHTAVCPVSPELAEIPEVQRSITVHDKRLGVVFVAAADLVYVRAGRPVVRETKTSARPLRVFDSLLREYPQLALYVLLLAAGGVAGGEAGRVELELLHPNGCSLEELDVRRPEVREEAAEVIGDVLGPLLADDEFTPRPGRECRSCEVRRWCAAGAAHVAVGASHDPVGSSR